MYYKVFKFNFLLLSKYYKKYYTYIINIRAIYKFVLISKVKIIMFAKAVSFVRKVTCTALAWDDVIVSSFDLCVSYCM